MTVTAQNATSGIPVSDDKYVYGDASGTALVINPGDYVCFSGGYIAACEDAQAYYKASGLGIAITRNPAYDEHGRQVINSAVVVATHGQFRVSGATSGVIPLGTLVFPASTGSAVNGPSGVSGVGSTWATAAPVSPSGATAVAHSKGVAQIIRVHMGGLQTGQYDIRLWPRNADYY